MGICLPKLWCCLGSSRDKPFIWVLQWFVLHSGLEEVPAASPNGMSIVMNLTSYPFSKFLVHVVFQKQFEMWITRIVLYDRLDLLLLMFFRCGQVQKFLFLRTFP